MKKLIIALVATLTLTGVSVGVESIAPLADAVPVVDESPVADAHYVPHCNHWYIADGEYTAGMGANCLDGAPGSLWSLVINCTNGVNYGTGWKSQGSGSFGKICPGSHVVNQHWIFFA
jgi:hypothetical protein